MGREGGDEAEETLKPSGGELTFSSIFCHTCLHRMMTMMATRMKMMATRQPIRMRVLLSSTLCVGSSSGKTDKRENSLFFSCTIMLILCSTGNKLDC